jgi:hypothetical protein
MPQAKPASEFNMTQSQLAMLRTKKIWEKVIGAIYNVNDEVNQITAHQANIQNGMAMVSSPNPSGKRSR